MNAPVPSARPIKVNRDFVRDLSLASVWLLLLALINQTTSFTIYSIFPYLIPVVILGWRNGVGWGFVSAAAATFAAIPAEYPAQHPEALVWAAGTTYLKLSAAVAGACFGKALSRRA